jgi:hypothetical protein
MIVGENLMRRSVIGELFSTRLSVVSVLSALFLSLRLEW